MTLTVSRGIITAIIRFHQFCIYGWDKDDADPTWMSTVMLTWTCVEPGVYHLAACCLTLRPLFAWIIFESPISSILSRSRLIYGGSSRGTYVTQRSHSTHMRTLPSQPGIDLEQRNDLLRSGKTDSVSLATMENEQQNINDLNDRDTIYGHREIMVSEA